MAYYEPEKIIQLLQLCSWRERTEMTQGGLIELSSRINPVTEDDADLRRKAKEQLPNERYFVDLLGDARKSLKEGRTVSKSGSYINLLLNHVGFSNWDEWKDAFRKPAGFFQLESEDVNLAGEKSLTVLLPEVLSKLNATLSVVNKTLPLDILSSREETLSALAGYALAQLESSSLIICALPLSWKDQVAKMRNPSWGELAKTGRILPVWIDSAKEWNPAVPFIPSLKEEQAVAGLPGILIGLLFLRQQADEQYKSENPAKSSGSQSSGEKVPAFNNSTVGFYMQGGTVHHLNTGGDQTITNYFGKESD